MSYSDYDEDYTVDEYTYTEDSIGGKGEGEGGVEGPAPSQWGSQFEGLVYNARKIVGAILVFQALLYIVRVVIVSDKNDRKYKHDGELDTREVNEATEWFLFAAESSAVFGAGMALVGAMHIMQWNVISRTATAAMALVSFAMEVGVFGFGVKMWRVGKSEAGTSLADEYSALAGITVVSVVALLIMCAFLLWPAMSETFVASETFDNVPRCGSAGNSPRVVVLVAAAAYAAVELFRLVVAASYQNSRLLGDVTQSTDKNTNNAASPDFMSYSLMASSIAMGFVFAAFAHLWTWNAASRVMTTASGLVVFSFNIWTASYAFKVWDLGDSNLAADFDIRITLAQIAGCVLLALGPATIAAVHFFANDMLEADVGDAQDTSPAATCGSLKAAGRKVFAGLVAVATVVLVGRFTLTAIFWDNWIDQDLSIWSVNSATFFAYAHGILETVVTGGALLLGAVHVWKWNVITSSSFFVVALMSLGLLSVSVGYAARSLGKDDVVFQGRTTYLDDYHKINHALAFVQIAVALALIAASALLRGGFNWADEATLAYRGDMGGIGMAPAALNDSDDLESSYDH